MRPQQRNFVRGAAWARFTCNYFLNKSKALMTNDVLTLHEVEDQDTTEDGLGGHLDPPLEEEGEEQHSDQTLAGQGRPGTLGFGFAEC